MRNRLKAYRESPIFANDVRTACIVGAVMLWPVVEALSFTVGISLALPITWAAKRFGLGPSIGIS